MDILWLYVLDISTKSQKTDLIGSGDIIYLTICTMKLDILEPKQIVI
jgi:hypothetical protein